MALKQKSKTLKPGAEVPDQAGRSKGMVRKQKRVAPPGQGLVHLVDSSIVSNQFSAREQSQSDRATGRQKQRQTPTPKILCDILI